MTAGATTADAIAAKSTALIAAKWIVAEMMRAGAQATATRIGVRTVVAAMSGLAPVAAARRKATATYLRKIAVSVSSIPGAGAKMQVADRSAEVIADSEMAIVGNS
jgi:hypothetical protein